MTGVLLHLSHDSGGGISVGSLRRFEAPSFVAIRIRKTKSEEILSVCVCCDIFHNLPLLEK